MARREVPVTAPARARVGLPVIADGSRRHPLLVGVDASAGACNNGCQPCVTPVHPVDPEVVGRHVVIRHREATLAPALVARVRALKAAGAASVAIVTNGRMLGIAAVARGLAAAGLDRAIVKLFARDAAAHDRHARVDGAYAQALAGIAALRAHGGVEVVVAFAPPADQPRDRAAGMARLHTRS